MPDWTSTRIALPLASGLAAVLGTLADAGLKSAAALGWRTAAAFCGVLGAGWIVSAVPALLDNPAEAGAPFSASVTGSVQATMSGARRAEWAEVQRAGNTFALSIAEFDGQPVRLLARRDINSQAREDQLQTGSFALDAAFTRISLKRLEADQTASFFIDMSRHASESGLSILRSAQAVPVSSKFGVLETADVLISDGRSSRSCLGFRHVAEGVSFSFRGWLCGSGARPADRQQLTCLTERITLVASGEDRQLRGYFSKAELQRQPQCLPPKLQAAGRKSTWLDPDQNAPALRRSGG
jgi:hypothetical protein